MKGWILHALSEDSCWVLDDIVDMGQYMYEGGLTVLSLLMAVGNSSSSAYFRLGNFNVTKSCNIFSLEVFEKKSSLSI